MKLVILVPLAVVVASAAANTPVANQLTASILAGKDNAKGSVDGTSDVARFGDLHKEALDPAGGVLYVSANHRMTIRSVKISDGTTATAAEYPAWIPEASGHKYDSPVVGIFDMVFDQ